MKKRIISMLLVLSLVISLVPTVSAAEPLPTPIFSAENVWAAAGSTVQVNIDVAQNPGILGATLTVSWADDLTLVKASNGTAFEDLNYQKPSGYTSSGTNFVWYGTSLEYVQDGTILTLTFAVSKNVKEDSVLPITVTGTGIYNEDRQAVSANFVNGSVRIVNYIPGDLDDNGAVDTGDLIMLAQYISDNCKTDPNGYNVAPNENAANVNDDGRTDTLDLILISQYISDGCETRPDGYNVELKPVTPKCSHTMQETATKAATCTEDGNIPYWYCTKCEKYFRDAAGTEEIALEETVIQAKGHSYSEQWSYDQTYHWHAAACEHTDLVEGRTEHTFGADRHCTVCGMSNAPDPSKPYMITYKLVEYNRQNGDTYLETLDIDNTQNRTWFSASDSFELEDPVCGQAYTFNGWYTEDGRKVTKISAGTEEDITLYARWTERTFSVTYNVYNTPVGAITDESKKSYKPSQGLAELPKPELNNYIWQGWFFEDGTEATSIPAGTTGNIVLIPHLTNERNLAISKKDPQPLVVEDTENGVILFAYELGTIKNVPLTDALWEIQSVAGLEQQQSKTYTSEITEEKAVNITDMISDTSVDSSTWTLSENWTDTVEVNEVWAQENSIDTETAKEQMLTDSNTLSLTDSKGVSNTNTHTNGITTSMDAGVDVGKETGSHFDVNVDAKYSNTLETSMGFSAGLKVPLKDKAEGNVGMNAGIKNTSTFELGLGAEYGNYDKNTTNVHIGTEKTTVDTNVNSDTSSWNSTATSARTREISQSESVREALKEVISTTKGYGKTYSSGGEGSNTQETSFSESSSTTTSSSLVYKSSVIEETYQMQKADGKIEGKYRLVIAGDVHVFAVVGYDVASKSYFTYTYNIMDDDTYSFLDYTPKGGDYGVEVYDYENSVLPFEIPYFVHEYVTSKTVVTKGVEYTTNSSTGTATVVSFDASTGETDVVIPSYISAGGNAYMVTGITANAFAGTPIRSIVVSDYITDIPENAFKDCAALEQVSGRFTTIGDYAFSGCTNLENFIVSAAVSSIGENAFANVPSITMTALNEEYALIAAEAAHPEITDTDEENLRKTLAPYAEEITKQVIQSAANSGAKNVTIDISKIAKDTVLTLDVPAINSFELIGDKKVTFKDLKITSLANTTKLSNLTVADCTRVPLEIKSGDLILDTVNITAPSFVLLLAKAGATVSLLRDSKLTAEGGNAVVAKNPVINSIKEESVWGSLRISGNFYYCGSKPDATYMTMASGALIPLTEDEFASYIQGCFKITFNPNGGSVGTTEKTAFVGQSVGVLPVPSREGHSFLGWVDENGAYVTETSVYTTVKDVSLTAKWSVMAYKAIWNTGAGYSITVKRTASPYAGVSIGNLSNGAPIYYGDVLQIIYTKADYYTITSHGVESITVTKDVTSSDIYAVAALNETSGWVKASEVPSGAQVLNRKWSYTLTTNTESRETSLAGYTQTGSYWVESNSGSFNYSDKFSTYAPGFDTSHSIYTSLNKSPYSSYENTTSKRVVKNTWAGYVYWHWAHDCGGAGAGNRSIYYQRGTGNSNATGNNYGYYYFGAFLSGTNFSGQTDSNWNQNDTYYKWYHVTDRSSNADTQGSYWFYRFDYYKCTYTDYYKMFQYKKVENKESTTQVSASSSISNVQEWVQYRAK